MALIVPTHTGVESGKKVLADLKADMGQLEPILNTFIISGTATGGSATTLINTSLVAGVNVFAESRLAVSRAGMVIRVEKIIGNTANTISIQAGIAIQAGDTYTISVGSRIYNRNNPLVDIPFKRANDAIALSGAHTFTRASTKTYWDSLDGLLKNADIDIPTFERMPDGGIGQSIMKTSTNIFPALNFRLAASVSAWIGTYTAVNDSVGIDGVANTAMTITDTDATQDSYVVVGLAPIASSTNTHTVSLRIAKNQPNIQRISAHLAGGAAVQADAYIDTATGLLSTDSVAGSYVTDRGLWWELAVPISDNASGNINIRLLLSPSCRSTLNGAGIATLTTGCVIDWPQAEINQAFATSPITGGATRAEDVLEIPVAGNRLAATEDFTVELEFSASDIAGNNRNAHVLNLGTNEAHMIMRCGSIFAGSIIYHGANRALYSTAFTDNSVYKWAWRHKSGVFESWVNGVKQVNGITSVATIGVPLTIRFGGWSSTDLNGHIRNAKYYDYALTDAQMAA